MSTEIFAELRILGFDCTPSQITEFLILQPTSTWLRGEPVSKTGKGHQKHQENGWAWGSHLQFREKKTEFRDLFNEILRSINPIKERFNLLPKNASIQLACWTYIQGSAPAITMEQDFIKLLADINASIDFDVYCLNGSV